MPQPLLKRNNQALIITAVLALAIYVVLPQISSLHSSWHLLSRPHLSWLALAIGLTLLTYMAAASTYYFLAFRTLAYRQLVLVQLAAMFVNKLLPAGIGALGANYSYLRHSGHTKVQAGSMVAVNNLLGVIGHLLVVAVSLIFFASGIKLAQFWQRPAHSRLLLGLIMLAAASILLAALTNQRFHNSLRQLKYQLSNFAKRPARLLAALISSIGLTLCNVLALSCCCLALGLHLHFAVVLLIFSTGAAAATVVPTPGGLGGFEAGLFTGFVSYHIAASTALAAAILYRLISYWLPLILGGAAFALAQTRHLFEL